jgi:hypothetical protein
VFAAAVIGGIARDPEFPAPEVGDKGIIARFDPPAEE